MAATMMPPFGACTADRTSLTAPTSTAMRPTGSVGSQPDERTPGLEPTWRRQALTEDAFDLGDLLLGVVPFGSELVVVGSDATGSPTSWLARPDGTATRAPTQPALIGTDPLSVVATHDRTLIAARNGLYTSTISESLDGLHWQTVATVDGAISSITNDNSQWLAAGRGKPAVASNNEEGAAIWSSTDARTWTRVMTANVMFSGFAAIASIPGHHVAVGAGFEHGIGRIETSTNETTWTKTAGATDVCGAPAAVTSWNGGFLAVGGPAPFVSYSSPDGIDWRSLIKDGTSGCANSAAQLQVVDGVIAVLFPVYRRPGFVSPMTNHGLYLSENAITWHQIDETQPPFGPSTLLAGLAILDHRFVIVGADPHGTALWLQT